MLISKTIADTNVQLHETIVSLYVSGHRVEAKNLLEDCVQQNTIKSQQKFWHTTAYQLYLDYGGDLAWADKHLHWIIEYNLQHESIPQGIN